jgi:transposase-like protein
MPRNTRYSPEVRESAVRMAAEHRDEYPSEWVSMATKKRKGASQTDHYRESRWVSCAVLNKLLRRQQRVAGMCPVLAVCGPRPPGPRWRRWSQSSIA